MVLGIVQRKRDLTYWRWLYHARVNW